jgi:hypothetical protein
MVAPAGRWIVDPDGAVVRAGLVRHYAARHGLWQLDPDIAYLSGDRLPDNVRGFEVIEELNYSERRLRQALSARDIGAVEILVRGIGVDPDALRAARIATGVGCHRPHRVRGGKPGNGIHLSFVTVVISAPRVRSDTPRTLAGNAPVPKPVPAREDVDDAHSQGGCDSRRGGCSDRIDSYRDRRRAVGLR